MAAFSVVIYPLILIQNKNIIEKLFTRFSPSVLFLLRNYWIKFLNFPFQVVFKVSMNFQVPFFHELKAIYNHFLYFFFTTFFSSIHSERPMVTLLLKMFCAEKCFKNLNYHQWMKKLLSNKAKQKLEKRSRLVLLFSCI